ncbi:MAG: hypothetical protein DLM69_06970 [Candidatus Chloroheliales bacterium]|nr:MAG: hypothetical protein DLM69_06970 [Chloroflexota bacterium]
MGKASDFNPLNRVASVLARYIKRVLTNPATEATYSQPSWSSAQIIGPHKGQVVMDVIGKLLDQLEQLGYYKYMETELVAEAKAQATESGYIYGDTVYKYTDEENIATLVKRAYDADAEDLAECGMEKFLTIIRPFLEAQGVEISSVEEECGENGYTTWVNGTEYVMYSARELRSENLRRSRVPGGIWALTTYRSFAMINGLLETAGSDERIYMYDDGAQGGAVFLTPEMYKLIRESTAISERTKPKAVDEESG